MKQDLHIGSAPSEEPRAETGSKGYHWKAWHECRAFIDQLRRQFGAEPAGSKLRIVAHPPFRGSVIAVVYSFNSDNAAAVTFTESLRSSLPTHWDEEAKRTLNQPAIVPATKIKRSQKTRISGGGER